MKKRRKDEFESKFEDVECDSRPSVNRSWNETSNQITEVKTSISVKINIPEVYLDTCRKSK
jgi:hypothetical protein